MAITETSLQAVEQELLAVLDRHRSDFVSISHQIHDRPEIGNEEFFASRLLREHLEKHGFSVERRVAGHETSFVARKSSGRPGPTIGFLAEYDALPGLGHACGHNLIGTMSAAAAIAVGEVGLEAAGGEVVVFGTPAEEGGPNGSAKGSFVKHGLFEGVDVCMMVHPYHRTTVTGETLAVDPLDFEFRGRAAHAAASPEEGINALDAVLQLFNGINALRQHVTDDVRIHGVILDGGTAPNIVPDYARARFFIRAKTRKALDAMTERVKAVAEGAALATGAELDVVAFQKEVDHFRLNRRLDQVFVEKLDQIGEPYDPVNDKGLGSTDAGNVSRVVPTIHPYIKIGPSTLVNHTDAFREAARSEEGDRALIAGAKALALTGFELLHNRGVLAEIKEEFRARAESEE
ncbi:MAG TPA: M20 family metallopeptidase [Bacillales bacterium]|nr:M20 family metallopeptidase [Bacillales bacterium]